MPPCHAVVSTKVSKSKHAKKTCSIRQVGKAFTHILPVILAAMYVHVTIHVHVMWNKPKYDFTVTAERVVCVCLQEQSL